MIKKMKKDWLAENTRADADSLTTFMSREGTKYFGLSDAFSKVKDLILKSFNNSAEEFSFFNILRKGGFQVLKYPLIAVVVLSFMGCKDTEPPIITGPTFPPDTVIMDLYAQPLETIQKYVYGKWKPFLCYGGPAIKTFGEGNLFEITKDSVIISGGKSTGEYKSFSYNWIKMSEYPYSYIYKDELVCYGDIYLICDIDHIDNSDSLFYPYTDKFHILPYYPLAIHNDTLFMATAINNLYKFIRHEEGK